MRLQFTRTEYENIKKSKELDEFSPAQFHAWINSNEDLFMKGESGEFENDLQKSEYNTLQNELAAFAKVEVWEEDKQSTTVKSEFYIREKQVDFTQDIQKSENGEDETITKGIYRDTALNRKLGRVGTEFGSQIQKSKSMPIGTIHNGFKKIAEGKWRKVSEHGMTREEHLDKNKDHLIGLSRHSSYEDMYKYHFKEQGRHADLAHELDSKDYSDEEVTGGEKKNFSTKEFDTKKEAEKRMSLMNSNSEYSDLKINKTSNNKYTISFKKSFPESTLSKSEIDKLK